MLLLNLKNLTCAIVGSSNTNHYGSMIDSDDFVIRINHLPFGRNPKETNRIKNCYGSKTNLWIEYMTKPEDIIKKKSVTLRGYYNSKYNVNLKSLNFTYMRSSCIQKINYEKILCIPEQIWSNARFMYPNTSITGCRRQRPTLGFAAFLLFKKLCAKVKLYGFNGLITIDHHKISKCHNRF